MSKMDWIKVNINHTWFNWIVSFLTAAVVFYLVNIGTVEKTSVFGLLGGMMTNVSVYLAVAFGLQFFQMGIGKDIQKEIYTEHNIAAAIYQGFLLLGIAIVIARAMI